MSNEQLAISNGGKRSRLDELIQKLCPNGVEYKRLEECCTLSKGKTPIQKAEPGEYPLVVTTTERKTCNTYQFDKPAVCIPLISSRGHGVACLNRVYYQEGKFALGNILCAVIPNNEDVLNAKFLYEYLNYKKDTLLVPLMKGGANVSMTVDSVKRVIVPVPPIQIQLEIVQLLYKFTELSEALNAELTARKKQYEYYRETLLAFRDNEQLAISNEQLKDGLRGGATSDVAWRTLGEVIVSLNTGLNPRQFFKLNTDDACNYYVTIREIQNGTVIFSDKTDKINDEALRLCNNRSNLEVGDVLFSGTGTIGETAVISEPPTNWNIKEGVYAIKPQKDMLNSRFLMYILRTDVMKATIAKKVAGGTVKSIPMAEMRKLQIPVPPLDVQNRLVNVLDNFDAICSDLKIGLPAEIEARQKQYEFYREKLLAFHKISS